MRVGIVGAGLLGMTAAWNLVRLGHRVTLIEGAGRCGGLAAPWDLGGVVWDRHYHVTLSSDTALLQLLDDIDLRAQLHWATAQTGFYIDGALHPFSSVLDYARFPALSLVQKARLAATILYVSRISEWEPLERITAVEWLTRLCGRQTVEAVWLPLLRAKVGAAATRVSAAFIWAIVARMYGARATGNKQERFGYLPGGYNRMLRTFEQHLQSRGTEIVLSSPVRSVEARDGAVVINHGAESRRFDRVLVTLAPALAARLCPQLTPAERGACEAVEYRGIVCASLLLRSPLTPYYITNIADAAVPFTGAIEMSALIDRSQFGGSALLYLPKYVASNDPMLLASDEAIEASFLPALQRMHPSFSPSDVLAFRVSRVPYVFPLPTLHYSRRLPHVRTSVPGLFAASSAHIVNGTLNVNETVKLANGLTPQIVAALPNAQLPLEAAVA
jgi:protoporphyrinogen oxidase